MASRRQLVYTLRVDNHDIREYVRHHMKRQGVTEGMLAARLGLSRHAVAQLLRGHGAVPQRFLDLLEALGLELVVVPKRG